MTWYILHDYVELNVNRGFIIPLTWAYFKELPEENWTKFNEARTYPQPLNSSHKLVKRKTEAL